MAKKKGLQKNLEQKYNYESTSVSQKKVFEMQDRSKERSDSCYL